MRTETKIKKDMEGCKLCVPIKNVSMTEQLNFSNEHNPHRKNPKKI
jgi:hypothetical protein